MSSLSLALSLACLIGFCLTVFKLLQIKLARSYRAFFAFCCFQACEAIAVNVLGVSSSLYFQFWVVTLPISWSLSILAVRELCGLVLERYQGLRTAGRWGMYLAVVIAAAISILTLLPRMKPAQRSRILPYLFPADRGVNFGLAIFLLVMLFLLSRFPVKPSRNVMVHATLYTVFFLNSAITTLLHTFWGSKTPVAVNLAASFVAAASAWGWFSLLTHDGEETHMNLPHYTPEQEERILMKLDALNETLLKVAHK
jgi:hypothetical protein